MDLTRDVASWLDVSRALPSGHPVWPGDVPFEVTPTLRIPDGNVVNISKIVSPTHMGTHLDAPWHYDDDAPTIESVPLDLLIGDAVLVDVSAADGPVDPAELPAGPLAPRVALFTGQPEVWTEFPRSFRPLGVALIDELARRGVRVVLTDAPSVDHLTSKDLPVHRACGRHGVTIVEAAVWNHVPRGPIEIVCLPLPVVGTDGAPVRMIARPRSAHAVAPASV